MTRLSAILLALAALCLPVLPVSLPVSLVENAQAGTLPDLACAMYADLNAQLSEQLGMMGEAAKGVTIVVTTPVNLDVLEVASPLARLLAEELATNFTRAGYRVQEIRKANAVLFKPDQGELILTRRANLVDERNARGQLVLAGTYTATSRHVRFNIKLMQAGGGDILAMSSLSLPVDPEAMELMDDGTNRGKFAVAPSVRTRFEPKYPSWR